MVNPRQTLRVRPFTRRKWRKRERTGALEDYANRRHGQLEVAEEGNQSKPFKKKEEAAAVLLKDIKMLTIVTQHQVRS
jgi:hypothetical protein